MPPSRIPFGKPFFSGNELNCIAEAVRSGSIAGDGVFTGRCHAWMQARLGCHRAFLTHSCTAALEMAAILLEIQPGDEIIMPSFTFVSTASAFVLRGGVPVFIDIRPDTLNMDEALIEAAITPRTRAIVPVHYAGNACEMDRIMAIARRHGLYVVEDAAQALLSGYGGRSLGTIGDLGCISFHETKNIISGEGGALLVNRPELAERAEIIREKGTNRTRFFKGEVDKYTWVDIGSSFLPSELTAAFLFAQLENADRIIDHRRALVRAYHALLQPLAEAGHLSLPRLDDGGVGNGHIAYVVVADAAQRAALIDALRVRDIHAVFHYIPLHDSPAGLRFARCGSEMGVTEVMAARILRLPLYFEMTTEDVAIVCGAVSDFFAGRQRR